MSTVTGTCTWGTTQNCRPPGIDDDAWTTAVEAAGDLLWALTGRQFGTCTRQVRPCIEPCGQSGYGYIGRWWGSGAGSRPWTPAIIGGLWYNLCSCAGSCSCTRLCEVRLPMPVAKVTGVWQDGILLAEGTDYVVADSNRVIAVGGRCWPYCQDLSAALTEDGTFGVEYEYGKHVPPAGLLATGMLAAHLAVACDRTCRLPDHVTNVSMDGVSMQFDPAKYAEAGLTGLEIVDTWVKAANPYQVARGGAVFSPDINVPMDTTGWKTP